MARACIFCGASPLTNAHIFRKRWIDEIFPGTEAFEHRHVREGDGGFEREWQMGEADFKVKCACSSCNAGWMERLDHEAEAILLTSAAIGYDVRVPGLAEQTALARWCLLVSVLADQTQKAPIIPASVAMGVPDAPLPDGLHVWLLKTQPPPMMTTAWLSPAERRMGVGADAPNAFFVTFGIGHLIVQAVVPTDRTPSKIRWDRRQTAPFLRFLWPPTKMPLVWPPHEVVPWAERDELSKAFSGDTQ